MKLALFMIALLTAKLGMAQDDPITKSWQELSAQFQYRADVILSLTDFSQQAKSMDTSYVTEIKKLTTNLSSKLKASLPDKSLIADLKKDNKKLMEFAAKILVLMENETDLKKEERFQSLMTRIEAAENRVFARTKTYNEACEKNGRKDLKY